MQNRLHITVRLCHGGGVASSLRPQTTYNCPEYGPTRRHIRRKHSASPCVSGLFHTLSRGVPERYMNKPYMNI